MPFSFYERLSLQLTVLLGILLIAVTSEVKSIFWIIAFFSMFAGGLSLSLRNRPLLSSLTVPTIFVIGFSLFDSLVLTQNYLVAAINLVLLLLSLKFLGGRRVADNLQMLGLSFLLVLGASAVTVDAIYGLLLLIYIFSGLWAMLLQNLRGHWESAVGDFESLGNRRGMLGGAFGVAVLVLGIGILLFTLFIYFAFPRVGMQFWKSRGGVTQQVSGFSETVRLNEMGKIQTNPAMALRVVYGVGKVPHQSSPDRRLRGIVLDSFDGFAWRDSRPRPLRSQQPYDGTRWHLRQTHGTAWTASITPEPDYASVLFLPLGTSMLEGKFDSVNKLESGNFAVRRPDRGRLTYSVFVTTQAESAATVPSHLEIPQNVSERVALLAADWAGDKSGKKLAATLSNRLTREFHYTTDLAQTESDSPIEDFLFNTKSGHCELFASSLAILLRTRGIPTRFVNGFAGGENWGDDSVVFRELHAHSWVEAFFEGEGWVQYDPTPSIVLDLPWTVEITKAYYTMQARLHLFWSEWFVDFDQERQAKVAKDLKRASTGIVGALNDFRFPKNEWIQKKRASIAAFALLLAIALVVGYRHYRFKMILTSRLTKMYSRKLRLAGKIHMRQRGETPLDYAAKVTRLDTRWVEFENYTRLYYKLRFGKATPAEGLRFLELHAGVPRKK